MSPPDDARAARASTGFPWAGLLALLLVLLVDRLVLGVDGPWRAIAARLPAGVRDVNGGVALDQLVWRDLSEPDDGRRRVVVLGSSRAAAGLLPDILAETPDGTARPASADAPSIRWLRLAHPGIEPYQIRSFAQPLADAHPDVVVLLLSEFDTHRPLRLVERSLGDDLSAVVQLAGLLGVQASWRLRESLLHFALAALWRPYRLRPVLLAADLDHLRRFARAPGSPPEPAGEWPLALDGGQARPLAERDSRRVLDVIRSELPAVDADGSAILRQLGSHQAITLGPHAAAQLALVCGAVDVLVRAGVRVLVVEGPLCPFPVPLYDLAARAEFRETARRLALDPSVAFLPTDASGPFEPRDFRDANHLGEAGARKLSVATSRAVHELLARGRARGGR